MRRIYQKGKEDAQSKRDLALITSLLFTAVSDPALSMYSEPVIYKDAYVDATKHNSVALGGISPTYYLPFH